MNEEDEISVRSPAHAPSSTPVGDGRPKTSGDGGSASGLKMPRIPSAGTPQAARRPQTCAASPSTTDAEAKDKDDPRRREIYNMYSPIGMKFRSPVKAGSPVTPKRMQQQPQRTDALPVLVERGDDPPARELSPTKPASQGEDRPNQILSPRSKMPGSHPSRPSSHGASRGAPPVIPASVFQARSNDSSFLPSKVKDPFSPKPPTHGSAMKLQASVETVKLMFANEINGNSHDQRVEGGSSSANAKAQQKGSESEGAAESTAADVDGDEDGEERSVERRRVEGLRKLASFVPPNYMEPAIRHHTKNAKLRHQFDPVTKKARRRHFHLELGQDTITRSQDLGMASVGSMSALGLSRRTNNHTDELDLPTCIAVEDMGNDPVSLAVVDGFIEATPGLREVRLGQLDERYAMVLRNVYKAVSRNVSIEQVMGNFPPEAAAAFKATLDGNQERREQRLRSIDSRKRERNIAEMEQRILWERQERKRNVLNCWRQRMMLIETHKKFHRDTLQQEHSEWRDLTEQISQSFHSAMTRQLAREKQWFAAVEDILQQMTERRAFDEENEAAIREQLRRDEATEKHEITTFLRLAYKKQNDERNQVFSEQFELRKALLREEKNCRRPLEADMHAKVAEFVKVLEAHERAKAEALRQAALEEARAYERAKRVEREHMAFVAQEIDRRKLIDAESSRLLDALKRKYFEAMLNAKNMQRLREQQELHERELLIADTTPPSIGFRIQGTAAVPSAAGVSIVPNAVQSSPGAPQSSDFVPYTMNAVGDLLVLNPNCIFSVKLEGPVKKLTEEQMLQKAEPLGGRISVTVFRRPKPSAPSSGGGSSSPSKQLISYDTEYTGTEGVCLYIPDALVHDGNVEVNGYVPREVGTVLLSHAPDEDSAHPQPTSETRKKAPAKTAEMIAAEKRLAELTGDDRVIGRLSVRNEVLPEDRVADARKRRKIERKKAKEEEERIRTGKLPPRPRRQIVSWNSDDVGIIELGYGGGQIESDRLQSYYVNDEVNSIRTGDTCEASLSPMDLGLHLNSPANAAASSLPLGTEVFRMVLAPGVSRHAISEVLGHLAFFSFANSGLEDTSETQVRIVATVSLDFVERTIPRAVSDALEISTELDPPPGSPVNCVSEAFLMFDAPERVTVTKSSSCYVRFQVPFFAASTIEKPLFCLEDVPPVQLITAFAFMFPKPGSDDQIVRWECGTALGSAQSSSNLLGGGGAPSLGPHAFTTQPTEQLPFVLGNPVIHGLQIVLSVLHPGEGDVFVLDHEHGVRLGGERIISSSLASGETGGSAGAVRALPIHSSASTFRRRSTTGGVSPRAESKRVSVREILADEEVVALVEGPILSSTDFLAQQKAKSTTVPTARYAETRILFLATRATTFACVRNTLLSLCFANLAKDPSTAKRHVDITVIDKRSKISCIARRIICIVPVDDITEINANLPEWGYQVYRSQCDTRADLQQYLPVTPFYVAPAMTVVDPDSRMFEGGYVEVEIVDGAKDGDCLYITDAPPFLSIERPNKWDPRELSKKQQSENGTKPSVDPGEAKLSSFASLPICKSEGTVDENPSDTIDILAISGLQDEKDFEDSQIPSRAQQQCPEVVIAAQNDGEEDSDSDYETTKIVSCYVVEGLAISHLPGTVTRKEIRRERRTTSVCLGDDGEDDGEETAVRSGGGGKNRDLGLSFMFGSSPAARLLAKKESSQGGLAFAATKLRVEFKRMRIESLQFLLRHICFKACAASERSDHYNGRRTIQFRAVVGDPHIAKFRKYDPFDPISVNVDIDVCEPLLQNSPQTVTYKEGSGAVPISVVFAQDGSPGSRPFNRGYFRADIVKGATQDDRILIRQMDPQQFEFALFLVDCDPALHLKKSALSVMPSSVGKVASFKGSPRGMFGESDLSESNLALNNSSSPQAGIRAVNAQVASMQVMHNPGEEAEGNANCTLPSPQFCLSYLRGVVMGKAKAQLWRCCELYNVEKNVIGMMVTTASELFVGFRESDKSRGRPVKTPARPTASASAAADAKKGTGGKKKRTPAEGPDEAEVRSRMINVPLPPDAAPLLSKDVAALPKLFAYENKSRNPTETKKVILFSLSDESTVSHMAVEVVLSLVDDLTEIHKPKQQLLAYRHNTGTSFPMFAGTTFFDPDTTVFNGYTITATTLSSQQGDILRFASLEEQRAVRELLVKDRLSSYRKRPAAPAGTSSLGKGGGGLSAPSLLSPRASGVGAFEKSAVASSVNNLCVVVTPSTNAATSTSSTPTPRAGRGALMFGDDYGGSAPAGGCAPRTESPSSMDQGPADSAQADANEPYEFLLVDEGVRTVYWLQRHKSVWSPIADNPKSSPAAAAVGSPKSGGNLFHSVANPAAGFVAFQGETSTVRTANRERSKRLLQKDSSERKTFIALCEQHAAIGTLRPVATLVTSVQAGGAEEQPQLKKTKSSVTRKGSVPKKQASQATGDEEGGSSAQGLKIKILAEDSDVDEETAALEEIVPPIDIKMVEALTQCILFANTTHVSKLKPAQRAVQLRLGAPGADEESKAKYTFMVSPAHFQLPDFKPCVYRRRTGAAHPFQRFTMSADLLIKSGFLLVEIKPETFDPLTDIIRMNDVGLNTTLRHGNKLTTVFKDVHIGYFSPVDVRKVTLEDGSLEDRPRGFVLQFDSSSRATSNVLQIFVRSFSYVNLAPKPNAQRKVAVVLSDGGYFETTTFETTIDVDHDEDTVPYELGMSEGTAVHIERDVPTRLFSDLEIQPQNHQLRLKLVPPAYLLVEGTAGDALRLMIEKDEPGMLSTPKGNSAPQMTMGAPPTPSPSDSMLRPFGRPGGEVGMTEKSVLSVSGSEALVESSPFTYDDATGAILLGSKRVATLVKEVPTAVPSTPSTTGDLQPSQSFAAHKRGTTVVLGSIGDFDVKAPSDITTAAVPPPSPPAVPNERPSGRKSTLGGAVRARLAASVILDPGLDPSIKGHPTATGVTRGAVAKAPPIVGGPVLRIDFEKFPVVHLQSLLSLVYYSFDAGQLPTLETNLLARSSRSGSKSVLKEGDGKGMCITRNINVTLSGNEQCGLTPAGQPMLHIQPTVDVCSAVRLFYFNGKPPSEIKLGSSTLGSSVSSVQFVESSVFGSETDMSNSTTMSRQHEALPWCIQGIDNELLPYMQVNCWCSRFIIDMIEAQGLTLCMRANAKSSNLIAQSGLVTDDSGRPLVMAEFGPGCRSLTLLPLPESHRIPADILQRLLRNVLLSDGLLADTNAVFNLTFETTRLTRQVEMARCASRKQNLVGGIRRGSVVSTAARGSIATEKASSPTGKAGSKVNLKAVPSGSFA
jgi:hypothetical protein